LLRLLTLLADDARLVDVVATEGAAEAAIVGAHALLVFALSSTRR
jgi:hypothetical protein